MKTIRLTVLGLLLLAPVVLSAQEDKKTGEAKADKEARKKEHEEKIDKLKIGFITTELALTTEEAEKFWPVYNEMETKVKELRKASRKLEKEVDEGYEAMSNEDAKKKMTTMFENSEKEVALKKEYAEKISKIIGEKRSLKLLSLEHEFKRELLDRLKEEGGQKSHENHGKGQGHHHDRE
ncbi:MAG TPA: hypothetical protein VK151_06505 [Fluviicola sp.]|nr:hypothetical protein [Fluviicola sp.]